LGIHLREVYGMTEACGPITLTPVGDFSTGNVGKPMPGTDVRIDTSTGEIVYKSPQVMIGYYKDEKSTKDVLKDGWIYSGDRGRLDENGHLHVVGRVKDVFKTSKGVYIVPNPIEEELLKNLYLEQVCVVGIGIPQPIALTNLSEISKKIERKELELSLTEHLKTINQTLVSHEKVSTIIVCKETWSEQNQLLTPTLKARRNKIDEYYGNYYLNWHDRKETVVWE
jgi:long-subunit acyl-CoA synthetase (AMP-forming)